MRPQRSLGSASEKWPDRAPQLRSNDWGAAVVGSRDRILTEFWLILAINVAGLTFSLILARWLTARDAGAAEIRRLGSAIERAAKSFLAREYRLIAAFSGLLALLYRRRNVTPVA